MCALPQALPLAISASFYPPALLVLLLLTGKHDLKAGELGVVLARPAQQHPQRLLRGGSANIHH
jgi:hypothetical protein